MPLDSSTITDGGVARALSQVRLCLRAATRPGARARREHQRSDELGDQTREACPPQDESPPAKVG